MSLLDDTTNAPAPVAIGYVRVSTTDQLDGLGLDIQRASIEQLATEHGYTLAHIYADEGISGKEDIGTRTGLGDALRHLGDGASVLIIPKLDRLARDLMVQEQVLAEAWRHGAAVVSCVETERVYCQPDNPDDPSRTLIRQVLGAVAAYERAMIRHRMVTGRRRRIATDGYAGGPEPYGWTDPTEQAILAHVEHARQHGTTWRNIAHQLNNAGHVKRNGKRWTPAELQRTHQRAASRATIQPAPLNLTTGSLL